MLISFSVPGTQRTKLHLFINETVGLVLLVNLLGPSREVSTLQGQDYQTHTQSPYNFVHSHVFCKSENNNIKSHLGGHVWFLPTSLWQPP